MKRPRGVASAVCVQRNSISLSSAPVRYMQNRITVEQAIVEGWFKPNVDGLCRCGCGETTRLARASSREKGYVKGQHLHYVPNHGMKGPCNPNWGSKGSQNGKFGPESANWKGGYKNIRGYILQWVPANHPFKSMRSKAGYITQHRLVMAESLGRPLTQEEIVHHKNGVRDDNRLENLELMDRRGHHNHHAERARLAEKVLREMECQGIDPEAWLGGACGV